MSRRATWVFAALASVLAVTALATALVFDMPSSANDFSTITLDLGAIQFASPVLRSEGAIRKGALPGGIGYGEVELEWRNEEAQKAFGPVRIAALWSQQPPRAWSRPGSACAYLLDTYGQRDGLDRAAGTMAVSSVTANTCIVVSRDYGRLWRYEIYLPSARCGTRALVFARVPWLFLESDGHELDGQKKRQNALLEENAPFLAALPGAGELVTDAPCEAEMELVARAALALPLALLGLLGFLWILLRRRLQTWNP